MFRTVLIAILTLAVPQAGAPTPASCLKDVKDFIAQKQKELSAATPSARPALVVKINEEKTSMARQCAARVNTKTIAGPDIAALAELYSEAGQPERLKDVVDFALSRNAAQAERPAILVAAIRSGLKEPISAERNARLEKYSDELDASSAATFDQKLEAHTAMNGYYRYDDIDAGILKHSNWIIDATRKATPEVKKKIGPAAVNAYVNKAEALAGQGMNDEALKLLAAAPVDLAGIPDVARSVDPEAARLKLVGTPGAAITAPTWLNMPAGKTDLAMPGSVTLLEFSAHWCTPCKESYPGVQRLLAKYGPKGFRVVLATQLYGYFESERPLAPAAEIERDRKYFAEHGMNVPIAIGNGRPGPADPNDEHYKVGGIPQIHLIDKQGRIRLVMVGYDDANEPKLAKMIEDLLK
jgi:thiol-disulfide isomerase/thioredoxin